MRVAVLYNAVADEDSADARDVLVQLEAVREALRTLDHEVLECACTLDLSVLEIWLASQQPDVVFNLVESLGGTDRLQFVVPAVLDALHVPYTGSATAALFFSGDKALAKERLSQAGLPTPAWCTRAGGIRGTPDYHRPFIVKSLAEHASFGINDDCVVHAANRAELQAIIGERSQRLGTNCFAEQYIPGREFNLSVLSGSSGVRVLTPAEIDFSAFPPGKPRIVGYAAKWDTEAFEYEHTPRTFDFEEGDLSLLTRLEELARAAFDAFGLGGYARVDFRVDVEQQPWILEVNANPCLSPDAGFAAALQRSGISWISAVREILEDAFVPAAEVA